MKEDSFFFWFWIWFWIRKFTNTSIFVVVQRWHQYNERSGRVGGSDGYKVRTEL
jgi:hypothetical protein